MKELVRGEKDKVTIVVEWERNRKVERYATISRPEREIENGCEWRERETRERERETRETERLRQEEKVTGKIARFKS